MRHTSGRQRERALRAAGDELASARARVQQARRELATHSEPGGPSCLIGRGWTWARDVMEARRAALERHPDVIGIGLGFRVAGGVLTDEPVVTVYVARKAPRAAIPKSRTLPRSVRWRQRSLALDVVSFGGTLHRQLAAGCSVGNLASGARCTKGTLGSFAIDEQGRPVAITAMHVVGRDRMTSADESVGMTSPSRRDRPGAPIIGHAVLGTTHGVDAARVALPHGTTVAWDTPAFRIRGWRKVHWPGDHMTRVRLYGARSGFLVGHIRNAHVPLPGYGLADTIIASIPTRRGDSGAAIVDDEGLVLGFLVGRGDDMPDDLRVFSPASLVLQALRCVIPPQG